MDKTELLYNSYQQFNLYFRTTSSTKKNVLYWKWLTVFTEKDYSTGALNKYLVEEYLGYSVEEIKGKTILVIKSITKLSKKKFLNNLFRLMRLQ